MWEMEPERPITIVQRYASELLPEEVQAEFTRYSIPAGDSSSRLQMLQQKYDEEYEASQQEHETYKRQLELKKTKEEYQQAVHNIKELEQRALERDVKTHTIVRQIKQNVAPKILVVRGITVLVCCALLRAMRSNSNVHSLDLSNNKLTDVVSESVRKMLVKNNCLRSLNLGYNALTTRSLPAIGDALKMNNGLTLLVLEANPIFALHKESVSSAIPLSSSTTTLPSSSNSGISNGEHSALLGGFAHIERFITALASNSSLTSLNLYATQINYEVGRALAQSFVKNSSIISLEVGSNTITHADLVVITHHLQKNQAKMFKAQEKAAKIRHNMKEHAEELRLETERVAKQEADLAWHEANAKKRAEIYEKEEWERARIRAEEEVQHLLDMEAQNKLYREKMDGERKANEKNKAKK